MISKTDMFASRITQACDSYCKNNNATHEDWMKSLKGKPDVHDMIANQMHDGLYLQFFFTDAISDKMYMAYCRPDDDSSWYVKSI